MDALTTGERENPARMLHERKRRMRDELLAGLARMHTEARGEQLSGTSDAGGGQIREATRAPSGRA